MHEPIIEAAPVFNLLLVDDEVNVLKALKRLFHGGGRQVFLAEGGAAGLAILRTQAIDLIISDMRMPHMDGAEFLTRAAELYPDTARILLTGYADIDSTIAAVNKGKIHAYCSKPWEDTNLKNLVHNLLEQKRLREERARLFEIINRQNVELKELNANLEEKVEKRTEQLRLSLQRLDLAHNALIKQYTDSIKAFAKIIEFRPGIRSGHALYIAEKAKEVAIRMGMSPSDVKDVVHAGLLLQIGKMSLPDNLLTEAFFRLNQQQKKRFLNHGAEGGNLLKGIGQLKNAALLITHQFEQYDGSGAPSGLAGAEIPLGSRILAVIRDYVAFLDGSITGDSMSDDQVKQRLQAKRHGEYDPAVVNTFLALLADSKANDTRPVVEISWTQLQPGMEAEEIYCNDVLYLKNRVLTDKQVEDILTLKQHGKHLLLRIRLGQERS